MKILNSKEKKRIIEEIEKSYKGKMPLEGILIEDGEGDIYFSTTDLTKIDFSKLRPKSIGMKIVHKGRKGRELTIEGTKLIKNSQRIIEINDEQSKGWMKGEEINYNEIKEEGLVIIKIRNETAGSGFLSNGKIKNLVDKNRILNIKEF